MKTKIKNIAQLKAEKKRIKQSLKELEHTMQNDWTELKQSLHPGKHSGESYMELNDDNGSGKMNGRDLIKAIISFGIDQAANKLSDIAEKKLNQLLSKRK